MSDSSTDTEGSDDSASTVMANPQLNPPYLYYRLFTENIAFLSEHPASPGNMYVGRVRADSIPPPQTVLLIKRRICNIEHIEECFASSVLFCSRESESPMDDGERVSILDPENSGSNPRNPMELVIKSDMPLWDIYEKRSEMIKNLSVNSTYPNPRYIYYKLYTEDGEIPAKWPILPGAEQSHSLARINAELVPPPHTLHAVIRCISFSEDFSYNGWHQIFNDINSKFPVENGVFVLRSGSPGSMPERPLVFVRSADMDQRIITKSDNSFGRPAGLLTHARGATLYTDGVVRREALAGGELEHLHWSKVNRREPGVSGYHAVYRVRDAEGKHGLVMKDDIQLR